MNCQIKPVNEQNLNQEQIKFISFQILFYFSNRKLPLLQVFSMIRKNENLRRQINHQIKKEQVQNIFTPNNLSHPLLLNLCQYKKQVTSLAINCIRSQSRSLVTCGKQKDVKNKSICLAKQNEPIGLVNNQSKQTNHTKTTQTKKKKYNYLVAHQNQSASLERTQQAAEQNYRPLGLNQVNRSSSNQVKYSKSYSLLNKKPQNYLTTPFEFDNHKINDQKSQVTSKSIDKSSHFQRVTLSKDNRPMSQQNLYMKQRSRTKNNNLTVQIKSSHNHHKNKPAKDSKSIRITQNQKLTYPKTQTYTSRSDYNIQKLKNKLDSYIKKHINHPL